MKAISTYVMRSCAWAFVLSLLLAAALATARAQSVVPAMFGAWIPTAPSSGLVRLTIGAQPTAAGQYIVHAWGACHPAACDWGTAAMYPYATSVSGTTARVGLASFHNAFSVTTLLITNYGNNELSVQSFTRFTDRSHRSNYTATIRMHHP